MYDLIKRMYPICRSITGNRVRDTLKIIGTEIPVKVREVESGTKVFDWVIPKEWNIKDAYIENSKGQRVVDFKNLQVINYGFPVRKTVFFIQIIMLNFSLANDLEYSQKLDKQSKFSSQISFS